MKAKPDVVMIQRLGRVRNQYPFIVELRGGATTPQTHRFADDHSRLEFVLGVRAVGRLLGLRIDEEYAVRESP